MEKKLVYDIHDKPKFGQMLVFALQQVLAILAVHNNVMRLLDVFRESVKLNSIICLFHLLSNLEIVKQFASLAYRKLKAREV